MREGIFVPSFCDLCAEIAAVLALCCDVFVAGEEGFECWRRELLVMSFGTL